jgi:hypothetical protein
MQDNTIVRKTPSNLVPQREHDAAVQFGGSARVNNVKAFPFFYNFTKYPYQEGIADPTTGIYTITGDSAEGPDGLTIQPGAILDVPIIMDADIPFHLLYIKYGAFRQNVFTAAMVEGIFTYPTGVTSLPNDTRIMWVTLDPTIGANYTLGTQYYVINTSPTFSTFQISLTSGGASVDPVGTTGSAGTYMILSANSLRPPGSREYLLYPSVYNSGAQGLFNASRNARIPYWTELDVSVYFPSSGGRDLYGGFQREPLKGATEEQPIPILNLQGSQDGLGMVKTPYQLAAGAFVNLRFRSRSSYALQVYGHLFGYKITI